MAGSFTPPPSSGTPADGSITTAKLAANAVTAAKVAADVATQAELDAEAARAIAAESAAQSAATAAAKGIPLGLTGATAATRYVGATASGAPASGTFLKGDFVIDQTGKVYICTTAGSPGTWTLSGGSASSIVNVPAGNIAATDVQGALNELDTEKQPLDSDLTALAAIAPSNDDLVQRKAGAWTNRTPAQVKTDLVLAKGDVGLGNVDNTSDANKPVSTAQALADTTITANTQTTSYTLVLGDAGKTIEMNSASATVVTIPPNSSVAFPVGTVIEVCRIGAGTVTITDGAGVTIPNRVEAAGTTSRTIANQWSSAALRKRATDVWVLVGDIA